MISSGSRQSIHPIDQCVDAPSSYPTLFHFFRRLVDLVFLFCVNINTLFFLFLYFRPTPPTLFLSSKRFFCLFLTFFFLFVAVFRFIIVIITIIIVSFILLC